MIEFKLNGKGLSIPTQWEEVNIIQYCQILKGTPSEDKLISIFTGIDCETLKNSIIIGLDQVLIALYFIKKPPVVTMPDKVGPFKIKNPDIQFESLAMFEDMKSVMINAPKDLPGFTMCYADMCAIYLQKERDGVYSFQKAKEMLPDVHKYPALEVIGLGSFFLIKLMALTNGTNPNYQNTKSSLKKSKPVTKSSRKHSAPTGRSRKRR